MRICHCPSEYTAGPKSSPTINPRQSKSRQRALPRQTVRMPCTNQTAASKTLILNKREAVGERLTSTSMTWFIAAHPPSTRNPTGIAIGDAVLYISGRHVRADSFLSRPSKLRSLSGISLQFADLGGIQLLGLDELSNQVSSRAAAENLRHARYHPLQGARAGRGRPVVIRLTDLSSSHVPLRQKNTQLETQCGVLDGPAIPLLNLRRFLFPVLPKNPHHFQLGRRHQWHRDKLQKRLLNEFIRMFTHVDTTTCDRPCQGPSVENSTVFQLGVFRAHAGTFAHKPGTAGFPLPAPTAAFSRPPVKPRLAEKSALEPLQSLNDPISRAQPYRFETYS